MVSIETYHWEQYKKYDIREFLALNGEDTLHPSHRSSGISWDRGKKSVRTRGIELLQENSDFEHNRVIKHLDS